ncbi:BTB/POZ domain-containing protein KCTD6-like [Strongylocentrotus purpuratus]|uniref:BTB domain-containing protein n=1 Tax=Strongylocentrotus purpuratus TaxID=7668 RepID=A0A7M7N1T4_STRPU|nr:BTB/POZ domain-containing protein KCTD6-like [Strongylocentrotus purpuratus]
MADLKPGDFVTLSVGGVPYTTTALTLTSFSDSMLGGMFSGRIEAQRDEVKGHFLIDRDGELFRYVLGFLRNRTLGIPEDFKQLHMLLLEAEFYQIEPMCEDIRELLRKPDPEVDPGDTDCSILIDGETVKDVESFKDLGSTKNSDASCTSDIKIRIAIAKKRMVDLHVLWNDRNISTGRPPLRWKDQIRQDSGLSMEAAQHQAQDRNEWRQTTRRSARGHSVLST